MNSALNEPLSAEIELLSASPDELDNLVIGLASAEVFERYGLDRPFYLQGIQFNVIRSGRAEGNYVQVRSATAMSEPFLTFLVEASWSRGRLLREYTVFLDPPTFAPRVLDEAPAVQAPSRAAPSDSGRIERAAPVEQRPAPAPAATRQAAPTRQPAPTPQSEPTQQPKPRPVADDTPYDTSTGGDYNVQRGDSLWGIASRVRPDDRLTMNQTMLAIFEANPEAFGGNINILRAGASLRIPSADDIFRISRGEALQEAQRQHAAWSGGTVPPVEDTSTRPSLTLVPPDDDVADDTFATEPDFDEPVLTREQEIENRIAELESADVPQQPSLIEIRDNELATLRQELARIRGEVYEPTVDEPTVDEPFVDPDDAPIAIDDIKVDDTDAAADDAVADDAPADDAVAADDIDTGADDTAAPADIIQTPARSEPSFVDRAIDLLKSWWIIIVGVVVLVGGALFWFMRRGDGDDVVDSWQPLDSEDLGEDDLSATESLSAPSRDDGSIVVVEQGAAMHPGIDGTVDVPVAEFDSQTETDVVAGSGQFGSLEDTFSSDTAINLDQSDPIAEADFHMAYGLYDQAADLINGALSLEPESSDLLTKLCEIYFVWGNRDAFIDAAGRLKSTVNGGASTDWDKIVIMGQQIAADDALFTGASAAGATKEVDLSFEAGMDETGALDMEFIGDDAGASDILDLGAEEEKRALEADADVDFFIDSVDEETEVVDYDDVTAESPTVETPDFDITQEVAAGDETLETAEMPSLEGTAEIPSLEGTAEIPSLDATGEMPSLEGTAEMPSLEGTAEMPSLEATAETPTIEQQFDVLSGTAELPSLDETFGDATEISGQPADETAEINLDDLGLDIDGLAETELASLDDFDATSESPAVGDTGIKEALEDLGEATGKNPEVDPNATGVQTALSGDEFGFDDTGVNEDLLDATGLTQVLPDDLAVETASDVGAGLSDDEATMLAPGYGDETAEQTLADDAATLLASLDDDDEDIPDFDFAKTEALPKEAFTGDAGLDETGELPAVASTDVDLDLDDLTAALKVSEAGDTVEQIRDDATVEQPRPEVASDFDDAGTVALAPDEMSDDLSDARTMTEVGTKLDLARAYVDMGDPSGARSILEEVLDEGDEGQRQQAQQLLDSLPS
jgi:pilus assembly protein FimV